MTTKMKQNDSDILKVTGINSKGFGTFPKIVAKDRRLTIEAKSIYAYFCSYAGSGNSAFPTVKTIWYDLGIGDERYYRHFNLLVKYGYISVEKIRDEKGKFLHNIYTLNTEIPNVIEEKNPLPDFPVMDNPVPENPVPDNTVTNINNSKNNSINTNNTKSQSISQSKSKNICLENEDRQTDELTLILKTINTEYLLEQKIPQSFVNSVQNIITHMYFSKVIELNGARIPNKIIRKNLKQLTTFSIEYAWKKFDEYSRINEIKNVDKYLRSIIYNSAHEDIAVTAEVNYKAFGNGRSH
jgi:hypothetical protein